MTCLLHVFSFPVPHEDQILTVNIEQSSISEFLQKSFAVCQLSANRHCYQTSLHHTIRNTSENKLSVLSPDDHDRRNDSITR